jgi:hypothetical protein
VQLAFQAGDEFRHLTEALGHPVSLDFHRRQPDRVAGLLEQAGLVVRARLPREPDGDGDFPEKTQQAFLLAGESRHRPTDPPAPCRVTQRGQAAGWRPACRAPDRQRPQEGRRHRGPAA